MLHGSVQPNLAIGVLVGSIPIFGDMFDIAWKANRRNYRLLCRHLDSRRHTWRDWAFMLLLACMLALVFHSARAAGAVAAGMAHQPLAPPAKSGSKPIRVTIETERRGVAQPGSASALGAEGRGFESLRPDQLKLNYFYNLKQSPAMDTVTDTVLLHLLAMEVNLTKRIDTPEGERYYPASIGANGRTKPNWVLVNGRPEKYESGVYYLEWYENGSASVSLSAEIQTWPTSARSENWLNCERFHRGSPLRTLKKKQRQTSSKLKFKTFWKK